MNTPVNFEIAKLIKKKGFDENCRFGYNGSFEPHHIGLIEFGYLQRNSELLELTYSAPTIAEVVMWLYEKHKIWIYPFRPEFKNQFYWYIDTVWPHEFTSDDFFNSPTEAYESAIEYTLNNLI